MKMRETSRGKHKEACGNNKLFLNPERVSMPDIDVDYKTDIRNKVVEMVTAEYGYKAVCNILTKGYQAVKGAIRDSARYYGAVKNESFLALGDTIRKAVPKGINIAFDTKMSDIKEGNPDETVFEYLLSKFGGNPNAVAILNIAKDVEGSFTNYGMHAAGLIISDNDDLSDYIPLKFNTSKEDGGHWTTQCNMTQGEALGLLKMDLLGLRNLNIATETARMIKKNHGISIDFDNIPFEDVVFNEIFAKGNTIGVFQFESAGMRGYSRRMRPKDIFDVIILNAMYRPGPKEFIPGVCDVKAGKCKPSYATPELEPILKETYGAIVYQEQVMEICRKLAGYSMGQADNIRRAMSKKKQYVIDAERESFVNGDAERGIPGCVANGISATAANKIYDSMVDFAKYAFNKSHAAAYSVLSYATAWLKYHYPAEYFCALLIYTNKVSDYAKFIQNAREMGVEVLPPDINRSEADFSVQDGKIYFGLKSVKSVGEVIKGVTDIRKEHTFESFNDYAERTNVDSRATSNLIRAGAFDSLGYSRVSLQGAAYTDIAETAKTMREKLTLANNTKKVIALLQKEQFGSVEALKERLKEKEISFTITTKNVPTIANLEKKAENARLTAEEAQAQLRKIQIPYVRPNVMEELEEEREVLGIYLSGHPIDQYNVQTKPLSDIDEGIQPLTGIIETIELKTDRSKKTWARITISDRTGSLDVNVFAKQYYMYGDLLKEGSGIIIDGRVEVDDFRSNEDEGDIVYSMNASKIRPARKQERVYQLELPNESVFFFGMKDILKPHMTEYGVKLRFYFIENAEFRMLNYCIPEEIALQLGAKCVA